VISLQPFLDFLVSYDLIKHCDFQETGSNPVAPIFPLKMRVCILFLKMGFPCLTNLLTKRNYKTFKERKS